LFEEAINLDPNFARHTQASVLPTWMKYGFASPSRLRNPSNRPSKRLKKIALTPDQPPPYNLLSNISLAKMDFDNAMLYGEKAVGLGPNDTSGYFILGLALRSAGRYEEATVNLETALRLNPLRPLTYVNRLAWSCLGNKQYDKAILLWTETLERNPDYLFAFQGLTAAYELSGNREKARWAAENVMRLNPEFSIAIEEKMLPYKDEAFTKRLFNAWRAAGLK
jgi:tetratricopeptide (TPR) repeat protein